MKWRVLTMLAGLALAATPGIARAQGEALFTGKVTSEAGAPVSGAQVYLERLNIGTQTKDDGTYRFTVPAARVAAARASGGQATLTVHIIGFKPKSVVVTLNPGPQTNDFVLAPQPVVLSQVVITGEGTVTTGEKLGNTVNTVAATDIAKSNEPNVTEALAAKAPNVQIQSQSGDPGASVSIQIRGIKTLQGDGQPLFVVDGIAADNSTINVEQPTAGYAGQGVVAPNRISDINPSDIESVTILKGSAAAAIYGARAAQGVVIITTKSGKSGPTRYSLRSSYSFDKVTQAYPLQRSFGEGDLENGVAPTCFQPDCSAARLSWGPQLDPADYTNALVTGSCDINCATDRFNQLFPSGTITTYDHLGEMFTTGHVWDNTLSVSGGDDRRSFYLSGGSMDHKGFVIGPNNDYKRYTVRLKGSQLIGEKFKLGANINYIDTRGKFIQRGNNVDGIMLGGLRTPPEFNNFNFLDSVSHLQRSYRFPRPSPQSLDLGRKFDNPIWAIYNMPATSSLGRALGNVDATWDPLDWLKVQWTGGGDYYTDQRLEAFPKTSSSQPTGTVNRGDFNYYSLDHNLTAIGSHTFSPNFSGTLTVGQNLNAQHFQEVYINGQGLAAPQPYDITNTLSYVPLDSEALVHRESYFGQATADLFDQLYLTAAVRNDGFSTFAQNKRRYWFPKASASWSFSKLTGNFGGKLDFAKARLAYGETGREPFPYTTLNTYQASSFFEYGGLGFLKTLFQGAPGLTSSPALGNNDLKIERTREYEGGVDFGLFSGFTDLSATYYSGRTVQAIFNLPVPPSAGATSQIQNAATLTNKGWEVTWNLHPLRNNATIQWDATLSWARNRNKVISIKDAVEVPVGTNAIASTVARVGSPVGSFEGYGFVRCGQGAKLDGVPVDDPGGPCDGAPKGALYLDATGFPVIDADSLRLFGSAQPNWSGSIRNSLTFFKKLELSALLDIRNGSQAYDGTRGALYVYGTHKDTEIRGQTVCFGPGTTGCPGFHGDRNVVGPGVNVPVVIGEDWFTGDGGSFGLNTEDFVENAGFVKLREISVAYTFDQPWVSRSLGLSSFDVRLSGRNLHTWTKYRGIDPEFNLEGAGLIQGVDWFNNPQNRSIVLTIGLNR